MARPRRGDWRCLKRIGRYLIGAPRYVQTFWWQDPTDEVRVYTDSDWAGCPTTCRSTSGGVMMLGGHCIKTWSTTQATVALSSAEAELYALTKGASQALGLMSLLDDLGQAVKATLFTDASAAIGIVRRSGLGKLRHLNVRYLWLQDQVRTGQVSLTKVKGTENPADLVTKNVTAQLVKKHLEELGVSTSRGRAKGAPVLAKVGILEDTIARPQPVNDRGWTSQPPNDRGWTIQGTASACAKSLCCRKTERRARSSSTFGTSTGAMSVSSRVYVIGFERASCFPSAE